MVAKGGDGANNTFERAVEHSKISISSMGRKLESLHNEAENWADADGIPIGELRGYAANICDEIRVPIVYAIPTTSEILSELMIYMGPLLPFDAFGDHDGISDPFGLLGSPNPSNF